MACPWLIVGMCLLIWQYSVINQQIILRSPLGSLSNFLVSMESPYLDCPHSFVIILFLMVYFGDLLSVSEQIKGQRDYRFWTYNLHSIALFAKLLLILLSSDVTMDKPLQCFASCT